MLVPKPFVAHAIGTLTGLEARSRVVIRPPPTSSHTFEPTKVAHPPVRMVSIVHLVYLLVHCIERHSDHKKKSAQQEARVVMHECSQRRPLS